MLQTLLKMSHIEYIIVMIKLLNRNLNYKQRTELPVGRFLIGLVMHGTFVRLSGLASYIHHNH